MFVLTTNRYVLVKSPRPNSPDDMNILLKNKETFFHQHILEGVLLILNIT